MERSELTILARKVKKALASQRIKARVNLSSMRVAPTRIIVQVFRADLDQVREILAHCGPVVDLRQDVDEGIALEDWR